MQRVIKFRIWDKNLKKFLSQSANYNEPIAPLLDINGNFYCWASQHWGINNEILEKTDLIIQQFTGLKDKNGKDIYEGDIIKWQETMPTGGYAQNKFLVKFKVNDGLGICLSGFYLEVINYKNEYTNNEFVQCCGYVADDRHKPGQDIRIIGNIFENPELLQ